VTARHLAHLAYLEAASIYAFDRLTRELQAHGAPPHLVAASGRAARDEKRHSLVVARLAKRAGGAVPTAHVEARGVRSLEAIAVENAAEGCVRETFGAAVALTQAARAADTTVRRAMARIARDETRHAELSWAVAGWLDEKLDSPARQRVVKAWGDALRQLEAELSHEPHPDLVTRLGVPTGHHARSLFDELRRSLWRPPIGKRL
jgi:hypothetical protein